LEIKENEMIELWVSYTDPLISPPQSVYS
jgi:hypothetical protein